MTTVSFAGSAHAADLRATNPPASVAPPNCFGSLWIYLSASADDCPLTYAGITLYGALDGGYGYSSHGAQGNPSAGYLNYTILRSSNNAHWLLSPNALSTSVIGVKMKEELGYGWSLIGVVEAAFDPYSGMLINAPRSRTDNNVNPSASQTVNFDSSRAGQWDNSQGYVGISNPVYGTLTFGRTNSLSLDVLTAYDPVASAAFSLIGFSSSFAGFGAGSTVRTNTAFTYRLTYQNYRFAAQAQVGGYDWGNPSNGQFQTQIGADFGNLSLDGVVGWTKDAEVLSSFAGSPPPEYDVNQVLKATLSNNAGVELAARYAWGPVRFYGGYLYARIMNPSDDYLNGFPTIAAGIFVPSGAVTSNAYDVNRIVNAFWTGARCSLWSNLDLAAGVYYRIQNDYLPAPGVCTGSGTTISSHKCAGSDGAVSFLIDYKPVKRVDLYGGVMLSNVWGGFAFGHLYTQNVDPTIGLRIGF